ncbi:DUF924 family protein [Acidovorax sp.]|uniref:DUF924 family protein n=1 Tax=Acidovorax sp. TaxID=1872122 RepID=UPI00391BF46E
MQFAHEDVLHFWFDELSPQQHFVQDDAVDARIRERFAATWEAGRQCELSAWRASPDGRLAEIIVLDQFSRNLHRGSPLAFAQDATALALAQELVAGQHDRALPPKRRAFAYMPYMHSESLAIHEQAMVLFDQPGLENNLNFEVQHRDIIARFGRYPHRNAVLGRTSTPEEIAFLQQPGSSF